MKNFTKYLVTISVASAITILVLTIQDSWEHTGQLLMGEISNAFFVPGILIFCFGALLWASNGGAFDMLTFAIMKLFDSLKKDVTKVKYRTFYDYQQAQKDKKLTFGHYMLVGLGFIVIALIFYLIYADYKV